jgi:GAF domain-containing protein
LEARGGIGVAVAQQALYDVLLDETISATGADKGTLQLLDRSVNGLRVVASRGFDPSFLQFFATVRVEDSCVCGSALRQAGRVIVPNVTTSEIFKGAPSREVLRNADVRSVQATPIFSQARWLIGVISTHWTSEHRPSDEELARLDAVVLRAARQIASN